MIRSKLCLAALLAVGLAGIAQAADNQPPEGFTALFNAKDLNGWHGYDTKDPRKFQAMSEEEQSTEKQKSLEDIKKHWSIDGSDLGNNVIDAAVRDRPAR